MATGPAEASATLMECQPGAPRAKEPAAPSSPTGRRRGRPMEMAPEEVLDRIRGLARHRPGLFRVHRERAALYARARRLFGSWEGAVRAAGLDYSSAVAEARRKALDARIRNRRRGR